MQIEYVGRNYQIEDRVRAYAEEKIAKALRFLEQPIDVRVTLALDHRQTIADVHVTHRHGVLQATEETGQMLDAINQAAEKVEKQARRAKKKFMDRRRRSQRSGDNGQHLPVDVVDRESLKGGGRPRIVRSSLLPIKPMSIEEAALRLDGSEHEFVVFRDAETSLVSVLYKRKDQDYGLIAPEL